MPLVTFAPSSTRDADNINANPGRLVNCYREPVQDAPRTRYAVKSVLGTAPFAQVDAVMMQALAVVDGALYAICGGQLFSIGFDGSEALVGPVAYGDETSVAGNNGALCIVVAGRYFVFDGASITQPAAGAFSDFGSVEFLGGYTILTEAGGRRFQWSDLADATDLPGLNFATAEATDEPLVRAFAINGILWLFKASSIEQWAITGGAGAEAFERIGGAVLETGLRSHNLVARLPNAAVFVGSDGKVHLTEGTMTRPVSTPAVETCLRRFTPTRCVYWEDEGHMMVAVVFSDHPAWVFDFSTGEWHERAQGVDLTPWPAAATVKFRGEWLVGLDTGEVAQLARVNRDTSAPLLRRIVSLPLYQAEPFSVDSFEMFGRHGIESDRNIVLLNTDPAVLEAFAPLLLQVGGYDEPPTLMVRFSRDGGATFGPEKRLSMGRPGDYMQRMKLRALGQFRRAAVVQVDITSPVEVPIFSDAEVMLS
jgi:hypothetical protein